MTLNRNNNYCDMPFTSEMNQEDFYTHASVSDLLKTSESNKEIITKIRTIGILESINGRFYIKDIDSIKNSAAKILVSMTYLKSSLKSPITPYTAQIFGTMQWRSGPVIFANIIQVLNTRTAIQLNDAIQTVCQKHLAKHRNVLE